MAMSCFLNLLRLLTDENRVVFSSFYIYGRQLSFCDHDTSIQLNTVQLNYIEENLLLVITTLSAVYPFDSLHTFLSLTVAQTHPVSKF